MRKISFSKQLNLTAELMPDLPKILDFYGSRILWRSTASKASVLSTRSDLEEKMARLWSEWAKQKLSLKACWKLSLHAQASQTRENWRSTLISWLLGTLQSSTSRPIQCLRWGLRSRALSTKFSSNRGLQIGRGSASCRENLHGVSQ